MELEQESPVCVLKSLPPSLIIPASKLAVDVNPLNQPAVAQFAATFRGEESNIVTPQMIAALTTKYLGPQPRKIPVFFMDNPNQATRTLILKHANSWDCGITYHESFTQNDRGVRLARARSGYWSYLGTDVFMIPYDQATMNLQDFTEFTSLAEYLRVVPHEFGHNKGFPHEHMRKDVLARLHRERTYAYYWRTYGFSKQDVDSQVFVPLEESSIMGTPPDVLSIMCYQFSGECTIDGQPIPGGLTFTKSDLDFARTVYPKSVTPGPIEPPKPVDPQPPVNPPEPVVVGTKLLLGTWSRVHQYTPKEGPSVFSVKIKHPGVYAVDIEGSGQWVVELSRVSQDASILRSYDAPGLPRAVAQFQPGMHVLKVSTKKGTRAAKFRVRVV
jgi:hypothetical protein